MLKQALAQNCLIAILRGLRPDEAQAVGPALLDRGDHVQDEVVEALAPGPEDGATGLERQDTGAAHAASPAVTSHVREPSRRAEVGRVASAA